MKDSENIWIEDWAARFETALKDIAELNASDQNSVLSWREWGAAAADLAREGLPSDNEKITPELTSDEQILLDALEKIRGTETWEGDLSWRDRVRLAREIAREAIGKFHHSDYESYQTEQQLKGEWGIKSQAEVEAWLMEFRLQDILEFGEGKPDAFNEKLFVEVISRALSELNQVQKLADRFGLLYTRSGLILRPMMDALKKISELEFNLMERGPRSAALARHALRKVEEIAMWSWEASFEAKRERGHSKF